MSEINLQNALRAAIIAEDVGLIEQFVAAGACINGEVFGVSPLIEAVHSGSFRAIEKVISLGANTEKEGSKAIALAIKRQDLGALYSLITNGVSFSGKEHEMMALALNYVSSCEDSGELVVADKISKAVLESATRSLTHDYFSEAAYEAR